MGLENVTKRLRALIVDSTTRWATSKGTWAKQDTPRVKDTTKLQTILRTFEFKENPRLTCQTKGICRGSQSLS